MSDDIKTPALTEQLVLRLSEQQMEVLDRLAIQEDRSRAYILRKLIDTAGAKLPALRPAPEHTHREVRKNEAHLGVCSCGAVLGKDFKWRMP